MKKSYQKVRLIQIKWIITAKIGINLTPQYYWPIIYSILWIKVHFSMSLGSAASLVEELLFHIAAFLTKKFRATLPNMGKWPEFIISKKQFISFLSEQNSQIYQTKFSKVLFKILNFRNSERHHTRMFGRVASEGLARRRKGSQLDKVNGLFIFPPLWCLSKTFVLNAYLSIDYPEGCD